MKKIIKGGTLVNEYRQYKADIVINHGCIEAILPEGVTTEDAEIIPAEGCYVLPGVIDDQVHFREPGLTHKGNIAEGSRAAAAGGVTSFMDMPNCNPQTTTLEALDRKFADAATKCIVNYSFYFGATNNNADLLARLDKTHVCGVKLFMGASTGNMLVDRMDTLRKIFSEAGMLIACSNTSGEEQPLAVENGPGKKAVWYTAGTLPQDTEVPAGKEYTVPKDALSLLWIQY